MAVRRSVRWRITALATLVTAVVLAAVGVMVVVLVQVRLYADLDASLEQRADQIGALASAGDAGALANRNDEDRFAQVLDADGAVVAATDNVAGSPALADPPAGGESHALSTREDLPIEDDGYRILIERFEADGAVSFVVVGENIDDLRDGVNAVRAVVAVVFPIAVVAIGAMAWWLVGRTLEPVEAIRRQVADVALDRLDRRVPAPGSGDEIDRLAGTMNEMLVRLEAASDQQRRFVADAAHELRTPLTRLRAQLELVGADDDAEAIAASALDDVVAMQALVDDLLFLARVDAHRAARPIVPVDLDAVVEAEVAALTAADRSRVEVDAVPVMAGGDAAQLARVVRNLLSNALRHAARRVRVEVDGDETSAWIAVDDDGPGIPMADRARVTDRFVRLDGARDASSGGAGLGLAIVRDIVELHGGSLDIGDGALGGARVVVRLPRLPD